MMDDGMDSNKLSNNIKPTQTILKQFKLFQKRNDEPRKTGFTQSME